MGVNIWINRGKVYLDVYTRGRRRRERLGCLTITGNKAVDKETTRLAEIARARRAQQVFSLEWGIADPVAGGRTLHEYMDGMAERSAGKKREAIHSALKHLEKFRDGAAAIGRIDETWVEDFQRHLLGEVSAASAHTYSSMVRSALTQAVKEKIIMTNPARHVKRVKVPESRRIWLDAGELGRLAETPLECKDGEEIKRAFMFA